MERVRVKFLRHQNLSLEANKLAEAGQNEPLTVLSNEIQAAFVEAQDAVNEFRNHIREHGCEQGEVAKVAAAGVGNP